MSVPSLSLWNTNPKFTSLTGEEEVINKKVSFLITFDSQETPKEKDKDKFPFPSDEFMQAYLKCQEDPNYLRLACLKRQIRLYKNKTKEQPLFIRAPVSIGRKLLRNSTVADAEILYKKHADSLNEKEKTYIKDISTFHDSILKVKNIELPNRKEIYSGYVRDGIPHGKGTLYFLESSFSKKPSFYKGIFNDGQMTGMGIRYYKAQGSTPDYFEEGEFKNGVLHGIGLRRFGDYTEEGLYSNGLCRGKLLGDPLHDETSEELSTGKIFSNKKISSKNSSSEEGKGSPQTQNKDSGKKIFKPK